MPTPLPTKDAAPAETEPRLLRIQEVADEIGLTTRAVRYYEELGLLKPAARSVGSYRLYDESDVERLRFIKGLRDDAGFALSEIRQLLDDEVARRTVRARFRETDDPRERRALLNESLSIADRQIATLRAKADRLAAMIDEAVERRSHLVTHLEELEERGDTKPHGRSQ
ncbi:MAG: MerR family transcriptional regulator [Chloroflexota bacterium]